MSNNTSSIYDAVMEIIQQAEELDGLDNKEYIKLMETIGEECYNRANICRAIDWKDRG